MAGSASFFHRLAQSVLVRDVQRAFAFTWDIDRDGSDELKLARRYLADVGIISNAPVLLTANYSVDRVMIQGKGFPLGVWFPDRVFPHAYVDGQLDEDLLAQLYDSDGAFGAGTTEIAPHSVIAADFPLLGLFDSSQNLRLPRLVCEGLVWTGVVTDQELLSPPARICLLAMALELEEHATALCKTFASECFHALPKGRQQKAMALFLDRHRGAVSNPEDQAKLLRKMQTRSFLIAPNDEKGQLAEIAPFIPLLIECTNFIDKATMICKCKLLLDASNNEVQRLFKRVEDLRNLCAHSSADSDDWTRSMHDLREMVPQVHRAIATIRETQEREWRVRTKTRPLGESGA